MYFMFTYMYIYIYMCAYFGIYVYIQIYGILAFRALITQLEILKRVRATFRFRHQQQVAFSCVLRSHHLQPCVSSCTFREDCFSGIWASIGIRLRMETGMDKKKENGCRVYMKTSVYVALLVNMGECT